MAKNVLFILHGIGQHDQNWAEEPGGPIDTLSKAATQYGYFNGKNLGDLIEFVPIRYDDIFDKILDQWDDLATGLGGAKELLGGAAKGVLDYMSRVGDDKNEYLMYGGDILLYRGFKLFAQRIQLRVISTIAAKIAERRAVPEPTPVRFSLLAHSLGTAVAHDALHHLGTEEWLKDPYTFPEDSDEAGRNTQDLTGARENLSAILKVANPFAPEYFRFDALFMLANTSVLLHTTTPDPYSSIVRPNTEGQPDSYCSHFYNVAHKWDPVPRVSSFRMPDIWKNIVDTGVDLSLDHLYGKDVHGFDHYLLHPDVHLRILVRLVNGYSPSEPDRLIWKNFPRIDPALGQSLRQKIESKLTEMVKQSSKYKKLRDYVEYYRSFKEFVESL